MKEEKTLSLLNDLIEIIKESDDFDDLLHRAKLETMIISFSSNENTSTPRKPEGWSFVSDSNNVPNGRVEFELVDNNHMRSGDDMLKRAKEIGADFSQKVAEKILLNQEKIPESWRKSLIIVPGTVWQRVWQQQKGKSDIITSIPCLSYKKHHRSGKPQWILYFKEFLLNNLNTFSSYDCFLRIRNIHK